MTMRFHLITNSKSSKQYPIIIDEKCNNQSVLEFDISRLSRNYVIEYVTIKNLQIGLYCTHTYLLNHITITHANFSAAAIYYKRHY